MVDEIRKLLCVEDVDRRIREASEELATFGPEREAAAQGAVADRAVVSAAEAVLAERDQENRVLEVDLQDVDQLVQKLDGQIYEVTSKHAMEAIQNEISAGKARKSELEDRILEVLDAMDVAASEISDAEGMETQRASERAGAEKERTARESELRQELEHLEAARRDEASGVEAEVLRKYEDVRRKAWPVLARLETKSCPACRIMIPPQSRNEIRTANKLVTCGSCHRILYGEKVAAAT